MKKILYLGYLLWICSILKVQSQTAPTSEQIHKFAAILYAESSFSGLVQQINPADPEGEMEKECLAIGITMHNYMIAKGDAFTNVGRVYGLAELLNDSNYTKGVNGPANAEYFGSGGDQARREAALRAAKIVLLKRNSKKAKQMAKKLQGAQYWGSNDLFRLYLSHFLAKNGFELADPAHGTIYQNVTVVRGAQIISTCPAQNPNIASQRQYTYLSTMTVGGTIFFKIHPEAAAQGIIW